MIKKAKEHSEGELLLNPDNTIVLSSTIEIIKQFDELGFPIITAELQKTEDGKQELISKSPVQVLNKIVSDYENRVDDSKTWLDSEVVRTEMHQSTLSTWNVFTETPKRIFRLWNEPILTSSGSLTETRNYDTYSWEMSYTTVINLKWNDIKSFVKTGKIVDEGCADGGLLAVISRDFPDCDLIGVEITT